VPPDVRWRLRPTGNDHSNHFGAARLFGRSPGFDQILPEGHSQAQPFRTSGGTAAKRLFFLAGQGKS